ncbi:MAG: response regulator [Moraxellaceae bacterium]|nr:MAG: response regulator [Moraxellaceae bacterium]
MVRILVADDQLVMRNMFKSILAPAGYDLTLAVDGKDAYTQATANDFDMIITDLYMPHMDGIELTAKLRTLKAYQGKPILIVSTESATKKKDAGKAAGATGWIVKPVSSDVLLPVVQKLTR